MNKTKTLLGLFLSCSLLLVGCNKKNNESDPSGTSLTPAQVMDAVVEGLKANLDATNISMRMRTDSTTVHDNVTYRYVTEQLLKFDGNKIYASMTQYDYTKDPVSSSTTEHYYELGNPNYQYFKSAEVWQKNVAPSTLNIRASSVLHGIEQFMVAFKNAATLVDNCYVAQQFSATVQASEIVSSTGEDFSNYTLNPTSISIPYSNVKLGIENGAPSYLELESKAVSFHKDDKQKTAEIYLMDNTNAKLKLYDFHDIGKTVVTLPTVA